MSASASSSPRPSHETRPTETKHLHFDLSHYPDHDDFTLHVGAVKHQVKRHDVATRTLFAGRRSLLGLIHPTRLTHYVEEQVELPANVPIMVRLTSARRPEGAKLDTLAMAAIHVPSEARTKALQERWRREAAAGLPMKPYPKLEALGVKAPRPDASEQEKLDYQKLILEAQDIDTAFDVASALVKHHPELMSLDKDALAKVQAHVDYLTETSNLQNSIYAQAMAHAKDPTKPNWVNTVSALGLDLKTPDPTHQIYEWSDETKTYAAKAIGKALIVTKDDPGLEGWSYVVQSGTTCVGGEHQPGPAMFAKFNRQTRRMLAAGGTPGFVTRDVTPNSGVEYSEVTYKDGKLSIDVTNDWLRWLSIYVEFVGADGKPVKPGQWKSRLPEGFGNFETDVKKFLEMAAARRTILGIPLSKSPLTVEFDWPAEAAGARLVCGGLGIWTDGKYGAWDTTTCLIGAVMTSILNFALVAIFLAAGVAFVWEDELDAVVKAAIAAFLAICRGAIAGGIGAKASGSIMPVLMALANSVVTILLAALKPVGEWIAKSIVSGVMLEAMPFVGWVCTAIAITANAALLAETTLEVLSSYSTIELEIDKVMDVTLTVGPDPRSTGGKSWPSQSDHWKATLQYDDGHTCEQKGLLDPNAVAGSIDVKFPAVPAGGRLKAIFAVYSKNDWLCGQAATDLVSAPRDGTSMAIPSGPDPFCITAFPVPLTVNTQYQFSEKLVIENNVRVWSSSPQASVPTATGPLPHGGGLAQLVGITLNEPTGALGYVWQASGLNLKDCATGEPIKLPFAFQNIEVVPARDQGWPSPNCGFAQRPRLVYDLLGPRDGARRNFYFDSRVEANAKSFPNHLRQVILDGTTPFSTAVGKSFGRFNLPMDSLAIHPAGYAVGISTANHKMEVLRLSEQPVEDEAAPTAIMKGGTGLRPGLFHSPLAVVATVDGRILVLDQTFQPNYDSQVTTYPARIQALDVNGNPVPCFADGSSKSPQIVLRPEAAPVNYLDMGVEAKGYIYVLKVVGDASQPANYALDIYQPDGKFLVQTTGVTAGKMVVSLWRDVYTLNYEQITGPHGPEPSVSKWIPSAPQA